MIEKITKKKKKKNNTFQPEHYVQTKGRLRLGGITMATGQKIAVMINTGFDNKRKNLGYYFYHNNKKICIRKKDVNYIRRIEQ